MVFSSAKYLVVDKDGETIRVVDMETEFKNNYSHSDLGLTGEALASGYIPGGEVIPTDFSQKVEYFINKFGHGNKEKTDEATALKRQLMKM